MDDLLEASRISASGMKAQSQRVRVLSENLANANSTGKTAGADPYRRHVIFFKNAIDKETGSRMVKVDRVDKDKNEFPLRFEPSHPAADANGYVKFPNVNPMIELMDIREAQRSYEANMSAISAAKAMANQTIDIIR